MQLFEQIVDEKAELDARRNGLLAFMDSKDFEKLPYGERNRLVIQSNAMRDYGNALNERIRAIEGAVAKHARLAAQSPQPARAQASAGTPRVSEATAKPMAESLRRLDAALAEPRAAMSAVGVVFDGPPRPGDGRFVEVEDDGGKSISVGKWVLRSDGLWALRISDPPTGAAWDTCPRCLLPREGAGALHARGEPGGNGPWLPGVQAPAAPADTRPISEEEARGWPPAVRAAYDAAWAAKCDARAFTAAQAAARAPRDVTELYYELLYAVARKFPESRHETALRYIREAELPTSQTGASAEKGS